MPVLFFACKKESTPYSNEFTKSQQAWEAYKATVNNSYSYIAYSASVFGAYSETTITVRNGKVTGRSFIQGMYRQGSTTLQIVNSWTEDSVTLNTHTNGATALTLDEIYAKAPKEWLSVDTKQNEVIFTTDPNGFIASCGYIPNGCMDDCFRGIYIKSITHL